MGLTCFLPQQIPRTASYWIHLVANSRMFTQVFIIRHVLEICVVRAEAGQRRKQCIKNIKNRSPPPRMKIAVVILHQSRRLVTIFCSEIKPSAQNAGWEGDKADGKNEGGKEGRRVESSSDRWTLWMFLFNNSFREPCPPESCPCSANIWSHNGDPGPFILSLLKLPVGYWSRKCYPCGSDERQLSNPEEGVGQPVHLSSEAIKIEISKVARWICVYSFNPKYLEWAFWCNKNMSYECQKNKNRT